MDDRDFVNNRGRGSRDTYYSNTKPRSRGVYLGAIPLNKRVSGYGPPKSQFGTSSSNAEDKRSKPKETTSSIDQNSVENKKMESVVAGKNNLFHYLFWFLLTSYYRLILITGKINNRSNVVDRSWKKNYENAQEIKSVVSSPASTQTAEANEESFATASEGSDSEETVQQMIKSKNSISVTKRATTVVVAKTQRKNFRSSSRLVSLFI